MFTAIFSRAFDLLGRHFVVIFGTAFFILGVPSMLGAVFLSDLAAEVDNNLYESLFSNFGPVAGYALVGLALYMINYSIITEIAVTGLARSEFRLSDALGRSLINIVPLLIVTALCMLMNICGFLLLIIPGIILMQATSVACTAYVAEGGIGIIGAIKRSFALTRDNRWALLGLFICVGVLQGVLTGIAEAPLEYVGQELAQPVFLAVSGLINAMGDVFTLVFSVAAYVCLREAKEGKPAESAADVFA
ncbi:hypothetical protein [Asticcacaulis sp. AND118]|uniref:hypothetical protein n=1 Tax=Asticcacaulis sp. AND118 TaxID=2840468 RepID=UPI001CFFA262|nr:hypothetical protein [Asticcacaulis sp. AND118]UDF04912.1 hypothetical protein LH365_16070 [Asticcacaulis sp. AND118]